MEIRCNYGHYALLSPLANFCTTTRFLGDLTLRISTNPKTGLSTLGWSYYGTLTSP